MGEIPVRHYAQARRQSITHKTPRMTNEPRNHHYIPQCYLRGFGWKHKKYWCTYLASARTGWVATNVRNVGAERDFLRIEIPGQEPNALERAMANMEGEIATSLKKIEQTKRFEGEDRTMILNLMALLAVRSPERREHWRQFQEQVAMRVMDLALSSKEMWHGQIQQMKEAGREVNEKVSYEKMKEFHERGEYDIEVAREMHIQTEVSVFDTVLQSLGRRNWSMYVTNKSLGPFVTCDSPVVLSWLNPPKTRSPFNRSPGFDLRNTQVYFPISQNLALIGEFDGEDCTLQAIPQVVGHGNVQMIEHSVAQLYSSEKDFMYYGQSLELFQDSKFMDRFAKVE